MVVTVLAALLVALGLGVPGGLFAGLAAAASGPFVCQPGFFQVVSGQLKELNPVTGAYTNVGTAGGGNYNAMGYNVADNYLYALSTATANQAHLLRVASDGSITDLGLPSGLPVANYVAGDMDDDGNLIVQANTTTYYSIDVSTKVATKLTATGQTGTVLDEVWIGGTLYGLSGTTLYRLNLATLVSSSATVTGVTSGSFGAAWSDQPDDLFFSDNATGTIYKVINFTGASPSATVVQTGVVTSNNDGAACKQADSPFNVPTANPDAYSAVENQPLIVPTGAGVLANDVGTNLSAAVVSEPSNGTLTINADGSFTYTPNAGYTGTDTFTYVATDQYGRPSNPATVTITTTEPPAPTAASYAYSTPADTTLTVIAPGVLTNDTGSAIAVTANTAPLHGTVTVNPNGNVSYLPSTGYSGTDSFGYTVTDAYGRTATGTVTITVTPSSTADSYTTPAGTRLTVAAADGVLANDTGTGLTAALASEPAHGTVSLASDGSFDYTPDAGFAGIDSFTYLATDQADSHSAPTTVTIVVNAPTAPTAADDAYITGAGSTLTVLEADGVLANDTGTSLTVADTTPAAHGTATVSSDGALTYVPDAGYSGLDTFTYTATDPYGQTATATVTITITPVAVTDSYTTPAGTRLTVAAADGVLANDTGTGLTAALASEPAHGTVSLASDGSFDYTPDAGFAGLDSFTYLATDEASQHTAPTNVTLTVVAPAAPTATDDAYTMAATTTLQVTAADGVLANDTGTSLTVVDATPAAHGTATVSSDGALTYIPDAGYSGRDTFTYTATDPYGQTATATVTITITPVAVTDAFTGAADTALVVAADVGLLGNDTGTGLTITSHTTPTHGAVTVASDGSFRYLPDAGYSGPDSFDYTVTDAADQTATAAVTVTVTPVADDDSYTAPAGSTTTVPAVSGVLANDAGADLSVTSSTQPTHGAVTVAVDGAFTYTPDGGYSGQDSFTYTATDASGQSTTATVDEDVTPTGRADTYAAAADTTLAISTGAGVLANDSGSALTAAVVTSSAHGALILAADGSFTYQPDTGYAGTDSFTYQDTDSTGQQTAPVTVTITVTPPGIPVAVEDAYITTAGTTLTVPAASGVLANDSGSALTVSNYTQPAHGSVTVAADGALTLMPTPGYSGADGFAYTVTDSYGRTSTAAVMLNVIPLAAPDTYHLPRTGPLTVPAVGGLLANDIGTGLYITSYTQPAHGTVTVALDGSFTYTPQAGYTGDVRFTYTATDAAGNAAQGEVNLTAGRQTTTTTSPSPTGTVQTSPPSTSPVTGTENTAPATETLPFTGFPLTTPLRAAFGLILLGLLLLTAGWRPRRRNN